MYCAWQLGKIDDAVECLEAILLHLHCESVGVVDASEGSDKVCNPTCPACSVFKVSVPWAFVTLRLYLAVLFRGRYRRIITELRCLPVRERLTPSFASMVFMMPWPSISSLLSQILACAPCLYLCNAPYHIILGGVLRPSQVFQMRRHYRPSGVWGLPLPHLVYRYIITVLERMDGPVSLFFSMYVLSAIRSHMCKF